jgi:membrane protease YdiL (CAAX protease family)
MFQKKALLISLFIFLFLGIVFFQLGDLIPRNPQLSLIIQNTFTRVFAGSLFLLLLYQRGYLVFHHKKENYKNSLFVIIPGLLIAINNFPISAYLSGRTTFLEPSYFIFLFLIECLSVGFFEEILFRYLLLVILLQRLPNSKKGVLLSIVISASVFGLIHLVNLFYGASFGGTILQIGYSFLMGLLWATVFLRTKNLVLPILLHALYNFFGQIMFAFGTVDNRYDVGTIVITSLLALFAIGFYLRELTKIDILELSELKGESY